MCPNELYLLEVCYYIIDHCIDVNIVFLFDISSNTFFYNILRILTIRSNGKVELSILNVLLSHYSY